MLKTICEERGARSSVEERGADIAEVAGSIPATPTNREKKEKNIKYCLAYTNSRSYIN